MAFHWLVASRSGRGLTSSLVRGQSQFSVSGSRHHFSSSGIWCRREFIFLLGHQTVRGERDVSFSSQSSSFLICNKQKLDSSVSLL